ncbi:MAG TPA: hypothetical protein VEA44_04525 [Caulobacter sp.]|nr:hypothetical protein [Caulobacter sp.]
MLLFRALAATIAILVATGLTASAANATDCQMLVTFEPRAGWYDKPAYDRMHSWFKKQPDRVKHLENFRTIDGARSLCVVLQGPEHVVPLFTAAKAELEQHPPKTGGVLIFSKAGSWARSDPDPAPSGVKGRGYAPDRSPPRDNPGRPPPQGSRF